MKERFKELGYWLEDRLKGLCGEITPDKRLAVILVMLLLFTIGNLYFTISSIYNWGRDAERKEQLKIEHIKRLELERIKPESHSLINSPVYKGQFGLNEQSMRQDSTGRIKK